MLALRNLRFPFDPALSLARLYPTCNSLLFEIFGVSLHELMFPLSPIKDHPLFNLIMISLFFFIISMQVKNCLPIPLVSPLMVITFLFLQVRYWFRACSPSHLTLFLLIYPLWDLHHPFLS